MLRNVARSCSVVLALSFLLAAKASACWQCVYYTPGCPWHCWSSSEHPGATSCMDACAYCIMSGSCDPFTPPEADGRAIASHAAQPVADLFARPRTSSGLVAFSGLAAVMEAASRLDTVRRSCQGMILARVVTAARRHEVRVQARRILV